MFAPSTPTAKNATFFADSTFLRRWVDQNVGVMSSHSVAEALHSWSHGVSGQFAAVDEHLTGFVLDDDRVVPIGQLPWADPFGIGGDKDEICANAGIAKVADKLK